MDTKPHALESMEFVEAEERFGDAGVLDSGITPDEVRAYTAELEAFGNSLAVAEPHQEGIAQELAEMDKEFEQMQEDRRLIGRVALLYRRQTAVLQAGSLNRDARHRIALKHLHEGNVSWA